MLRIDAHHHLWDQRVRPQTWMDEATAAVIAGPYSPDDWAAAAHPTGIRYGVFVQTVPVAAETPEVLALAEEHPELAAVVGWLDLEHDTRPAGEQLDELLAGPGGKRLAGVRVAAEYSPDPDWLDSRSVHDLATALGERGLCLDLLMSPANLDAAARLAAARPDTRMVVNHLAKPTMREVDFERWEHGMRGFAGHAHVACKLSGFLTFDARPMTLERLAPYAETALGVFGPAHLMFGSDWPVSVLGGGYAAAVELAEATLTALSNSEQSRVWAGTALEWYPQLDAALEASTTS
ncbi:amidohydrolase family protein [Leucobacter albus]|uniref:Amidohydrolase family protein n=1 Tax=Leucobacter albus TaxID=272210 RepID=A0ABW3TQP5_9MICO